MVQGESRPASRRLIGLITTVALVVFLLPHSAFSKQESRYEPAGPFRISNQMPLYLYYISMPPETAECVKKGRVEAEIRYDVANTIIDQHEVSTWPPSKRKYWVTIDGEVNQFTIDANYGLLDNIEVNLRIPYIIFNGGYLDSFIQNFEDTFHFKTPNARQGRGKDEFAYSIKEYNVECAPIDSPENAFGDAILGLKVRVLSEKGARPAISLRTAVKFPNLSDAELIGSKKWNGAAGIVMTKSFLKKFFLYANLDYLYIEKPDFLTIDTDSHILSLGGSLECSLTDRLGWLAQVVANTTPYPDGIPCLEQHAMIISTGFSYRFSEKVTAKFAINENTNSAAPDFGMELSIKARF